jgi:ribose 5-phosphate isomerase B
MNASFPTRIVMGSDHAGLDLKNYLHSKLAESGYAITDVGTYSQESVDYPDYASKVATSLRPESGELGILVCGTGIGVCMTANKFPGIRAALIYSEETARLARQHNNANILCLGGRTVSPNDAIEWVRVFLESRFEGGRHQRRIDKISALDAPARAPVSPS